MQTFVKNINCNVDVELKTKDFQMIETELKVNWKLTELSWTEKNKQSHISMIINITNVYYLVIKKLKKKVKSMQKCIKSLDDM